MKLIRNGRKALTGFLKWFLIVFLIGGLYHFKMDNRPSQFFSQHSNESRQYARFQDVFGEDNRLLIAVEGVNAERALALPDFAHDLDELDLVDRVDIQPDHSLDRAEGKTQVIALTIRDDARGPGLLRSIGKIASRYFNPHAVHVVGPAAVQDHLGMLLANDLGLFLPLLLGMTLFGGWVLNGDWRSGAAVLVNLGLSSGIALGIYCGFAFHITMLSCLFFPLIFIVSMSGTIHLVQARRHVEDWHSAAQLIRRPCLLANLTTGAAFASLGFSNIPAIRDLGLLSVLGVSISTWLTLRTLPRWLDRWRYAPSPSRIRPFNPATSFAYRSSVLAGALAITVLVVLVPGQFTFEANILTALGAGDSLRKDMDFFESHLHPTASIEFMFEDIGSAEWQNFDLAIDRFKSRIASRQWPVLAIDSQTPGIDPKNYLRPATGQARMTVYIHDDASAQMTEMRNNIANELAAADPPGRWFATGLVPRWLDTQEALLAELLRGFGLAFTVVFVLIGAGLQSWRAMLAAVWPNMLPIGVILGAMKFFAVPLDLVTILLAVVCLGFVVDDSIHVLHSKIHGYGAQHWERTREALIQTSLIASAGFLVFSLSSFGPIRMFGLLGTLGVWVALAADLLLLPILIDIFRIHHHPMVATPQPEQANV